MKNKLPSDLREAESNVYESIQNYFSNNSEQSFLSINLKFEGLRITIGPWISNDDITSVSNIIFESLQSLELKKQ